MSRKLVCYPPIEEARLLLLREAAYPVEVINAASIEEATKEIADAEGFFGKITPGLLAAAKQLTWIQTPTASLEHYVFPELLAHPATLTNMRGLFSDVIADHVLGMMLCFVRHLHTYIRNQAEGRWAPVGGEAERQPFNMGPAWVSEMDRRHKRLSDCTLGVVGVGAIGAEICRRASAFEMEIFGVDSEPRRIPGVLEEVWPIDRLPELLERSDFVVIAAPQTPATEGLFKRPQFERMRRDAVLINIGRGAIVSLKDLVEALDEKLIAGAALDVFEVEPLPKDHPLWRMPNVILTPHVAACSVKIPERHLATLLENVRRFSRGEAPLNVVDKSVYAR
ncbi:MAG TPA: D-2-hydroxyacid dehydrogenase [Caulifigura sp.]|jgi:phosphoglycerate dehydrogenase-like enzyme|nr:D-2-hydroxyacid dehydrogenase [Caulifigura sp.]